MATVPIEDAADAELSDAELIAQVRAGTIAAYGTLYQRHSSAAHNLARQLSRSSAEADDLVSEAFAKVLDTLRAGKGPDTAFRAYLLTALRHTAYDRTRKDRRVDLTEDMSEASGALGAALTVPFSDSAVAGLERSMAARAFATLPERWQAVLWHTEIEQQSPAEVAPLLGLTPNGVSALAYRAREGLRQAYLQVHLAETTEDRCRATADRLGAWTRDGLSKRERAQVEAHLDECERCRALAAELADVNGALRSVVAPLVLGGAALAYLATAGAAKASAATAGLAAAGAAGGSGAAAGAAAAGPRQFAGVAASGVAIAAAVAVALAAGGGTQEIPAAAQQPAAPAQPAPAQQAPKPAAPKPAAPKPQPPAQQPPAPAAPPVEPAPAPVRPPSPEPSPSSPAPSPAPPAPLPPKVTASQPQGIELVPEGAPVDVPITVRNDGGSPSEPVVLTLNLPPGVQAVAPGGGGGAPAAGTARTARAFAEPSTTDPASTAPSSSAPSGEPVAIVCPAGSGTITCRTEQGLAPGQSAVLRYRLQAGADAQPGTVTGNLTAGSEISVSITVQVRVKPAPDQADLWVLRLGHGTPLLYATVRNTGPLARPASISVDVPASVWAPGASCTQGPEPTCTTLEPLEPGETLGMWIGLRHGYPGDSPDGELPGAHPPGQGERVATVTGRVGSASRSQRVDFGCWWFWCWSPRPGRQPAHPDNPTTTSTTTPAPEPTPGTVPSTPKPTTSRSRPESTGPGERPTGTTSGKPRPSGRPTAGHGGGTTGTAPSSPGRVHLPG